MIDFYFSVIILGSIEALVPLFFEARRTGRFVWHFTREYSVRSDRTYGTLLVFLGMGLLVFYFAWLLHDANGSSVSRCRAPASSDGRAL